MNIELYFTISKYFYIFYCFLSVLTASTIIICLINSFVFMIFNIKKPSLGNKIHLYLISDKCIIDRLFSGNNNIAMWYIITNFVVMCMIGFSILLICSELMSVVGTNNTYNILTGLGKPQVPYIQFGFFIVNLVFFVSTVLNEISISTREYR